MHLFVSRNSTTTCQLTSSLLRKVHARALCILSDANLSYAIFLFIHASGSAGVSGAMDNADWTKNFKNALDKHCGELWCAQNNSDPVPSAPPIVLSIGIWNHVDSGYQIYDPSLPHALPTEIGTRPSGSLTALLHSPHCESCKAMNSVLSEY